MNNMTKLFWTLATIATIPWPYLYSILCNLTEMKYNTGVSLVLLFFQLTVMTLLWFGKKLGLKFKKGS